jgi:hypothetical protein
MRTSTGFDRLIGFGPTFSSWTWTWTRTRTRTRMLVLGKRTCPLNVTTITHHITDRVSRILGSAGL